MSLDSRTMSRKSCFDGFKVIRRIGGDGRKSAVYEIGRADHGIEERCAMKAVRMIETEKASDFPDESEQEYFRQKLDRLKQAAMNEVRSLFILRECANIMRYYDCETVEWSEGSRCGCDLYIRMELLEPLMGERNAGERFSREEAIGTAKQLARAVRFCHEHGIIHRDIKPQNVFRDRNGIIKLGDFGIASISEETINRASTAVGTPSYAAPEQFAAIAGAGYDERVDIYSLGLVLYELLNNNMPPSYGQELTPDENIRLRLRGEKLPPPKNADRALYAVIMKACAVRPRERYKTAAALLSALEKAEHSRVLPVKRRAGLTAPLAVFSSLAAAAALVLVLLRPACRKANNTEITVISLTPPPTAAKTAQPTEALPESTDTAKHSYVAGDNVLLGRFELDGDGQNGLEALEWKVISVEGDEAVLLSRNTLYCIEMTEREFALEYENSAVRAWLNNEFFDQAFTYEEKQRIIVHGGDSASLPVRDTITQFFNESYMVGSPFFMQLSDACKKEFELDENEFQVYALVKETDAADSGFAILLVNSPVSFCVSQPGIDYYRKNGDKYLIGVCPVIRIINIKMG